MKKAKKRPKLKTISDVNTLDGCTGCYYETNEKINNSCKMMMKDNFKCSAESIIYVEDKGEDMATIRINRETNEELDPRFTLMEVRDLKKDNWTKKNVIAINPDGSCLALTNSYGPILKSQNIILGGYNTTRWDYCREIIEPTYRSYNKDDNLEHLITKIVKNKETGNLYIISGVRPSSNYQIMLGSGNFTFVDLFKYYEFPNGSPCGVLEN